MTNTYVAAVFVGRDGFTKKRPVPFPPPPTYLIPTFHAVDESFEFPSESVLMETRSFYRNGQTDDGVFIYRES
jgi:hypothetical protein